MKEDYQKALKKSTLFLLSNPIPFNIQNYQKQQGRGTSDHLLFRLQNKFRKIPLLVMYYLFWVIQKLTSVNLCKPIYDIINYSPYICPFKSNISTSRDRLELFQWKHKIYFIVSEGLSFDKKNTNLIKNSRHKPYICLTI